nr:MBL fold metallo-hydrolase [Sedimentibacter sp. B4]
MSSAIGEIKSHNIRIMDDIVEVGDLAVRSFDISHDAAHPVGYNIFYNNKKISLVTDTGCVNDNITNSIMDSDLLLVESNHDEDMVLIGPYPWPLKRRVLGEFGHMSNDTAGHLISKVVKRGTEIVLLGHLSKENNFPQLAYKTVENILKENCIEVNPGICLDMTYRDRSSRVYEI